MNFLKKLKYLPSLWEIFLLRNLKHRWRRYNILRSSPRKCMEYRLFPYFHAHEEFQNILLVGVAECTVHYEDYFKKKKSVYTIDNDPEKVVSGIKGGHIVDSIENVDKYFKEGSLDCVLMNGVYGWGLDDEKALIKSLENIRKILRKGGVLLFGWDKVPKHDPIDLDSKPVFKDFDKHEIFSASRIELDNKHHHIFDIYQKPY